VYFYLNLSICYGAIQIVLLLLLLSLLLLLLLDVVFNECSMW